MTKTWFITGASSGLGRQMTEQLLVRGDKVFGTERRKGSLEALQDVYRDRLTVLTLDLMDTSSIRSAVAEAFNRTGQIEVIVSNAGYGLFGAAEELTDEQIEMQVATNLVGSIQLIRAALPYLRKQGGGRIMQVSSEGGQIAYPNFSLYHATKWGIEGFVEAVAKEVMPFGIDFIIAQPGPTATNFGAGLIHAEPMAVYDATPAGEVRHAISSGNFELKGDAERTAQAMIEMADRPHPPLRLALGSTAFHSISSALSERLTAIEAQRDIAYSADRAEY